MDLDPLWASVGVTVVLVLINIYYAWQARQTVKEMEKARKAEFIPRIKATLFWPGPTAVILKTQNVGKGAAVDIDALIKTVPEEGEPRKWQQPLMAPSESELFFLPESDFKTLAGKFDYIVVEGFSKDIFGEKYIMNERLDLKELLKNIATVQKVWKAPDPVREIEKRLKNIARDLHEIARRVQP